MDSLYFCILCTRPKSCFGGLNERWAATLFLWEKIRQTQTIFGRAWFVYLLAISLKRKDLWDCEIHWCQNYRIFGARVSTLPTICSNAIIIISFIIISHHHHHCPHHGDDNLFDIVHPPSKHKRRLVLLLNECMALVTFPIQWQVKSMSLCGLASLWLYFNNNNNDDRYFHLLILSQFHNFNLRHAFTFREFGIVL